MRGAPAPFARRNVSDIRCVLPARALLGEGPLWDPKDRLLYSANVNASSLEIEARISGNRIKCGMNPRTFSPLTGDLLLGRIR